ncbi:EpsG family protein [Solibaculum mannosilyticum]|uniref:EpsG family protein n=1 Tax=Solibaculum mannosilyticum TaxID=2780922 RepID=A0A7I8D5E9_9FIRM|nr:EpsG family protein [Solibaculum mannosilyticum]BCI61255.1 hypothetical protein C12CBH8_18940 [Solibaculum mannosilyticum]
MILSMAFYGISYLLTAVFAQESIRPRSRKFTYLFMALTVFVPSFLAAIRDQVGTDYMSYYYLFEKAKSGVFTDIESGYKGLMWLVVRLGGDFHILSFVVMAITIVFIYAGIVYFKEKIEVGPALFAYLMLNYQQDLNMVRQAASIAIAFYAFRFLLENKLVKYIIVILLASTIHLTALIMIPFYWIFRLFSGRYSLGVKFISYAVMIVLVLNLSTILGWMIDLFPSLKQYEVYISQRLHFGIGTIAVQMPYLLPGLLFYRKLTKDNPTFRFYVDLMVVGIILRYAGYFGVYYLNRFSLYFIIPAQFLLTGCYAKAMKAYRQRWIVVVLGLYIFGYWFWYYGLEGFNDTVPFTNIFGINFPF